MEMGKDILAVAPDGRPCAYQLKNIGGKQLTLGKWRSDLEQQIVALVHNQIVHPSITSNKHHRSFIVINGELSEEVSASIDQFNRGLRGRPKLRTIVKGDLLDRFTKLGSNFWPPDISVEFKLLLELLLVSGASALPKEKLAALLEAALDFNRKKRSRARGNVVTRLNGAAILCSYAIIRFQEANNHVAEFEAWTMLFAHLLGEAERNRAGKSAWLPALELVSAAMFNSLGRLADELEETNGRLFQGDPITDRYVVSFRATTLVGLLGLFGLWRTRKGIPHSAKDDFLRNFAFDHADEAKLWGEAAAPYLLAAYLFRRTVDASWQSDGVLMKVIRAICVSNHPRQGSGLPSPYYSADRIMFNALRDPQHAIKESFAGSAYTLEGFFHLLVRGNWKQAARQLWPDVSRIMLYRFEPEEPWRACQWRIKRGLTTQRQLRPKKQWSELKIEASDTSASEVPKLFRQFPLEYLAFLFVYPHRWTSSGVRWLDAQLPPD